MNTITLTVQLTEITCGKCGGVYALTERYRVNQYENGGSWTCPYCQTWWGYTNNSENANLKQQVAQLQSAIEHKEALVSTLRKEKAGIERSRSAVRAAHTRTCNRVKNGVCPCCNRTFQNLMRHMHMEHPEYKAVIK